MKKLAKAPSSRSLPRADGIFSKMRRLRSHTLPSRLTQVATTKRVAIAVSKYRYRIRARAILSAGARHTPSGAAARSGKRPALLTDAVCLRCTPERASFGLLMRAAASHLVRLSSA